MKFKLFMVYKYNNDNKQYTEGSSNVEYATMHLNESINNVRLFDLMQKNIRSKKSLV
jgi:hypothetical protein